VLEAALGNSPHGLTLDAGGNFYFAEGGRIHKFRLGGTVTIVAGNGVNGFDGDGGPADSAQLNAPGDVEEDVYGNLYLADTGNRRVRKVNASTGVITTIAGNGESGPSADGVPATSVPIEPPGALALDGAGNLYFSSGHSIRKLALDTGIITSVAGKLGQSGFKGDGGPATAALLSWAGSLALDRAGNLYVMDTGNYRVRKIEAATGNINTVVGGGGSPVGRGAPANLVTVGDTLSVDQAGNLLIAGGRSLYKLLPFSIPDTQPPRLAITQPTTQPSLSLTSTQGFKLAGTASDNQDVTHVSWADDHGRSGLSNYGNCCTASDSWEITVGIEPLIGLTTYTVTAWDAFGNNASATLKVNYNPPNAAVIRTLAGQQLAGFEGENVSARNALLYRPAAVALDAAGNLFIADTGNHRVRKLTSGGIITTVAGSGILGAGGDGGPATAASLNRPGGLAVDGGGNLYIADTGNHRVRKVSAAGVISTVAGTGQNAFGGDGGLGPNAQLSLPVSLALDSTGNLYIADYGNHRIRKLATSGILTTVAGSGFGFAGDGGKATAARLSYPRGVLVDAAGNLLIADTGNHRVRQVASNGAISTIAGNGLTDTIKEGVLATESSLAVPSGLALDRAGNLFVSTAGRVRKIGADGLINSVAGTDSGFVLPATNEEEGAPALNFGLSYTTGIAVDGFGNLFIADPGRNRVLIVSPYQTVVNVQAASFTGNTLAPESIAAAFGANLATTTQVANAVPLPTTLAGTTVKVLDSGGTERFAPLFFVSPTQVNYQVPPGTALGQAEVRITNARGQTVAENVQIAAIAPGLFSADASGRGVAVAAALRVRADGAQLYESVSQFDPAQNRFVARPLDLGPESDQLFLLVFGTGSRFRSSLAKVTAKLGEEDTTVSYAGAQGNLVGLDQVNLRVPRSLLGRGEVELKLQVDGQMTNGVKLAFAGAPCQNALAPANQAFTVAGGAGSVNVMASNNCSWTAASQASWVTISSGATGRGNGTVRFDVAANPNLAARTGTLRIAGQLFTVTQAGQNEADPPSIAVTLPSTTGPLIVPGPYATLSGTASARAGIVWVRWSNARNGSSGLANGTTQWQTENIPLLLGDNIVTVTAYDAQVRTRSAQATVRYAPDFIIQTVAGGGTNNPGDGGPATAAELNEPRSVAFDAAGNLFIGTYTRLRKVTPAGIISTFAGNGGAGYGGDDIEATGSRMGRVGGVAFDRAGNVYLADLDTHRVRKVDITTGIITTVAGRSNTNNAGFGGDGGPATQALLQSPTDIAFDAAGNLYIVDAGNYRVRRVDAVTKVITTIAGMGRSDGPLGDGGPATAAALKAPNSIAFDRDGQLFIADSYLVRKVNLATGIITTVAGGGAVRLGDGVLATETALFCNGLTFDRENNLYLSDAGRVRKVSAATGIITTIAGTGDPGYGGDGGPALEAKLSSPADLLFDQAGNLYVVDFGRVRKLIVQPR
jgi:uncharacterized protein (TIGR03437 family)